MLRKGTWFGVEFHEPIGDCDGSIFGRRFFTCQLGFGCFYHEKDDRVAVSIASSSKTSSSSISTDLALETVKPELLFQVVGLEMNKIRANNEDVMTKSWCLSTLAQLASQLKITFSEQEADLDDVLQAVSFFLIYTCPFPR
jgi:dynactin complex subunit